MIVTTAEMKAQIGWTEGLPNDDALMDRKLAAAQDHLERLLGFKIETTYPSDVPAALKEAVLQLAAHWFENREASVAGVTMIAIPFGVEQIISEYRGYSFDG